MSESYETFELPLLPDRPEDSHKGTYGTVIVVGGSRNMIGAPALAANAAFRTGAGLVKLACPESILPHCLTIEPCATGIGLSLDSEDAAKDTADILLDEITDNSVIAIGTGFGIGDAQKHLIRRILTQHRPVVVDADGLNNLAQMNPTTLEINCPLVLTPHPGEFKRLADVLNINDDPTDHQQRPHAAINLSNALNAIVVLKGNQTIVSDGNAIYHNTTGNPALATGGSGDVLTGIIASLIAQQMKPMSAATVGVYLHGLAGDLFADIHGPAGLKATDLPPLIPNAMQIYRES